MGILNNICVALCTPNPILINFIAIPAIIIETYLTITLFMTLLNISASTKQKFIHVAITSFIGLITIYFISNPFNIFINYIFLIVFAHILYKISFIKCFCSVIFSAIIFNLIGAFLLNPYISILNITMEKALLIPMYRLLYITVMYSILFLIIIIMKKKKINLIFLEETTIKTKIIIFINLILGIITLALTSITLFYYVENLPVLITFFSFISFVAYFCISIYSSTKAFKLMYTTRKLESAEEYNKTLNVLHDSVRTFKHDFDNIMTTLGGYIKTSDMEGLKKYFFDLRDDCQKVNNLYFLNPQIINNDGIYNLLTQKYHEADSKNIHVNISFLLDFSELNMKIYEFARILGILLDNAIEASSECEKKIMNLTFRNDTKNSRQIIIIENTYENKNIDTEIIYQKGFSGKEHHTGLGLWEVRKILNKYNNLNLYTTKTDKFFAQQLEIYY